MELVADAVGVAGARSALLQPTSFVAPSARVTVVAGDPGHGQVALALALGGRIPLATGSVLVDGVGAPAMRARHVALVDVPEVSAPEEGLALHHVLAEELAFAGRPSGRAAVARFLADHGILVPARTRFEELDPADRVRVLVHAAAERTATRVLVVAGPDRRGGDPHVWWPELTRLAAGGLTVVALVSHPTLRQLDPPLRAELGVAA